MPDMVRIVRTRASYTPEVSVCETCGKDIIGVAGIEIGLLASADGVVSVKEAQVQLGKYEVGKVYSFCVECLLKTLGAKKP